MFAMTEGEYNKRKRSVLAQYSREKKRLGQCSGAELSALIAWKNEEMERITELYHSAENKQALADKKRRDIEKRRARGR